MVCSSNCLSWRPPSKANHDFYIILYSFGAKLSGASTFYFLPQNLQYIKENEGGELLTTGL